MPTDRALGFDPVAELAEEYVKLESQLVAMVAVARTPGRRAFLLARLEALREELRRISQLSRQWATTRLPEAYRMSAGAAQFSLEAAGLPLAIREFTAFDRRAARALVERTALNLSNVRTALEQGLLLGDPRLAVEALESGLALDGALVRLDGGLVRVATPGGRFWRPGPYARMLARTGVADARRVAFRARYLQNGVDVVRVVANGTTHDVCRRWEGELLSLTGATPGLPTVAEARAAGLFHPNCRHRYVVAGDQEQPGAEVTAPSGAPPQPEPARTILGRAPRGPLRVPAGTSVGGLQPRVVT